MKKIKKEIWLKTKKEVISFAIISLIGGVIFLRQSITGNAILKDRGILNLLLLISALLIICSIILFSSSIKKG